MGHPSEVLSAEVAAMREQYHELAQSDARPSELAELSGRIKVKAAEVNASIASGGNACEKCGGPPMGMLKTPSFPYRGLMLPPIYSVGCTGCDLQAHGFSIEQAVSKWNDRDYFVRSTESSIAERDERRAAGK